MAWKSLKQIFSELKEELAATKKELNKLTNMKLSKRLEVLKLDTQEAFKKYVPNKEHHFHDSQESDYEGILNDLTDRDVIMDLPQVFYNNSDGIEIEGYAVSVSRDKGLVVINYQDHELANIGFSDINLLQNQIKLVELLKEI